ncbi:MAG: hydrogenase 4 subunit F [Sporomusaceae bacterium]|nr:hydrogenase 4 subunit F [Sporomusaceae bacterium]
MHELILFALGLPLLLAALSLLPVRLPLASLHIGGGLAVSAALLRLIWQVATAGRIHSGWFLIDELTIVPLLAVALLGFSTLLFSKSYMGRELAGGHISGRALARYYALLQVFIFTMIGALVVENLGMLWVMIEATTLASALLVAFNFNRSSLEATWKYVMVCTVGICLALLGTILLYYAQVSAGEGKGALSWLALTSAAARLDPDMTKLAFVFILIGYGTKAGLAPMHTWLPDAHSQAPSPVSGLLSGALLPCAFYAIMRNMAVVQYSLGPGFAETLLLSFGLLSIALSAPFILLQHDLKRLLAYSSVENMGLIAVGIGISTPLAISGALLHMLYHALTKSALFYLAGLIYQDYHTKHLLRIRGLLRSSPLLGGLFFAGLLAITGMPPFAIFTSKFLIIQAVVNDGRTLLGGLYLLLLGVVFAGLIYYGMGVCFGPSPKRSHNRPPLLATLAIGVSLAMVFAAGFYLPPWLGSVLTLAAALVTGG